ncbi:GDP-mannose 4,6-dehydratase [Litorivicinus sp.]|nr:GDP-mannose 4,6-dehydratase [Litorivicinus sp.]
MKVLVLGSNSFSGSHFVDLMLKQGFEVFCVSRSPEPKSIFLPESFQRSTKRQFHQFDMNWHDEQIGRLIEYHKVPYVVNFAAQGMVSQSWDRPLDWYKTNVIANVALHERMRHYDFLEKYVHVSTPEVYGTTETWMSENFNFNPSTPYAVSRASCDLHLKSFFEAYEFPVVWTRSANVYGPGQQLYRIVPRAFIAAISGSTFPLHGGGLSERSFIHISDVANATLNICMSGKIGSSFHISTTDTISIRGLVEQICKKVGVDIDAVIDTSGERLGKDKAYLLDSTKLRTELGWTDAVSLADGLEQTFTWIHDNWSAIKSEPLEYLHKI